MSADLRCSKCNGVVESYFRVERIGRDGQPTVTAVVCSIPCLLSWGASYAAMAGTVGVMKAKSMVDQVVGLFWGPPKQR